MTGKAIAAALAIAALGSGAVFAQALPETAEQPAAAPTAADLAQIMGSEVAQVPIATATVEDYEAALAFVISQAEYPVDLLNAALDLLSAANPDNDKLQQAISNVRKTLGQRAGTGSIAGAGGGLAGSNSFQIPAISIGGGSSNYGG